MANAGDSRSGFAARPLWVKSAVVPLCQLLRSSPSNGHRDTGPDWSVSCQKAGFRLMVYFISVMTGLSLALIRMTIVFDVLSVAFLPKWLVSGGV